MENEMAQKVSVLLVDDIDGSDADETIQFGLDGTHYEIDLNSDHAGELRGQLQRYVKAARNITSSAGRPARGRRTAQSDGRNKEIRDWPGSGAWRSMTAAAFRPASWRSMRQTAGKRHRPVLGPASSPELLLRIRHQH
jgi:hypothetical protein